MRKSPTPPTEKQDPQTERVSVVILCRVVVLHLFVAILQQLLQSFCVSL